MIPVLDPLSTNRARRRLPNRAGASLKPEHVDHILSRGADIGFFEVHAENYMGEGGLPHAQLAAIRERYPLSLHGVGLSIGSPGRLDREHLRRLRRLIDRYQPETFSEHLAWSSHGDIFLNDLLPLPYTRRTLKCVADHVDEVQETLGRPMLLENPSTYLVFEESDIIETDFLREISERTGCGLLLDVSNVLISAANHDTSPEDYIDHFPLERVGEIHLAGHEVAEDGTGRPLLIDTHDRPVADVVWQLYARAIRRAGARPTLIEWDAALPSWPVLAEEAALADAVMLAALPAGTL
jgi:uncharacterized protein (UPF0276 family)